MSNIIQLPGAASAPIINPKKRGRRKGTISLTSRRRKRDVANINDSPYHPSVPFPRVRQPGRYHYPKELLLQKWNSRNSYGWTRPHFGVSTLSGEHKEKFISPLDQLFRQLATEGHNVEAAELELQALREVAAHMAELGRDLFCKSTSTLRHIEWDVDFDGYRDTP
jgi:hypothetical protein